MSNDELRRKYLKPVYTRGMKNCLNMIPVSFIAKAMINLFSRKLI